MRPLAALAVASLFALLAVTAASPAANALPEPCYGLGSHSGPVYLDVYACAGGDYNLIVCLQTLQHTPVYFLDQCYVYLA